jgi:hypothetical protein
MNLQACNGLTAILKSLQSHAFLSYCTSNNNTCVCAVDCNHVYDHIYLWLIA